MGVNVRLDSRRDARRYYQQAFRDLERSLCTQADRIRNRLADLEEETYYTDTLQTREYLRGVGSHVERAVLLVREALAALPPAEQRQEDPLVTDAEERAAKHAGLAPVIRLDRTGH